MTLTFIEYAGFTQSIPTYFESDGSYADFQQSLMKDTQGGAVMRGCGGLRKIRWFDARRGKGKRGGLRLVYLHVPEAETIALLDVYDKDEADDLTQDQRKLLSLVARRIREELLKQ